jgi:two-component system nitrate/nitrite response regulator NarP
MGDAVDCETIFSASELDLVKLVGLGLRNREIADRLGFTEGTVKTYLHALYRKTGTRNRTELAVRASQLIAGRSLN